MEAMIDQLVQKAGVSHEQATQVVAFLKENAHRLPEWLGSNGIGKAVAEKFPGFGKLIG
jgi:hypothetical protein